MPVAFFFFLAEGSLNINNITMLGLIRLERGIDGRSLSGVIQHQNHAGRKREREEAQSRGKNGGREGGNCLKSSHLQRLFSE